MKCDIIECEGKYQVLRTYSKGKIKSRDLKCDTCGEKKTSIEILLNNSTARGRGASSVLNKLSRRRSIEGLDLDL